MNDTNTIDMYWWEGYYGFNNLFLRLMKGQSGYIKNFGDFLSPLIISLLSNKRVRHSNSSGKLLALGSIFFALRNNDTVWGSGFLNAKHIQFASECSRVKYLAVRGPETRKLLIKNQIDCPEVYGDPSLLFPLLVRNNIEKKYRIGIVPHFSHYKLFCDAIKGDDQIHIVDVEKPLLEVIHSILSCEIILSTSLHGIIFSESYGIPALMLTIGKPLHGDLFKFEDYFHSTNRSISFIDFNRISKISILSDLALKQSRPDINLKPLINAFPYTNPKINLPNDSLTCWSDFDLNKFNFKHSYIPPRFLIST
jgi:pyruvyltransferase